MLIKIKAIQHLKFKKYIGIIHRALILTTAISLVKQSLAIDVTIFIIYNILYNNAASKLMLQNNFCGCSLHLHY